jgi:hypothetical protein
MLNYTGNNRPMQTTECQRDLESMIARHNKNIKVIKKLVKTLDSVIDGDRYMLQDMMMVEGYGLLVLDLKKYKQIVKKLIKEQEAKKKEKK